MGASDCVKRVAGRALGQIRAGMLGAALNDTGMFHLSQLSIPWVMR